MAKHKTNRAATTAMSREHLLAVQGRRGSSAAGGHDSRPKRQRTRSASKSRAIADSRW